MFIRQLRSMKESNVVLPSSLLVSGNGQERRKSELPVRRQKARIVEKVRVNRVTIILADTGSGKSSQVPQMLLEEGMGPVLCTQPRRLAVAAVAKRVAEERGCTLGNEVGYQIGQLNVSMPSSKIVFKTSGVLLEELRTNGAGALAKYKVLILDEVHERSVESDLVLTCVKQLLRSTSMKLVLMSATADLLKYEAYFKDIDRGERVEKIAIQNPAEILKNMILSTKVMYLEQVVKTLGNVPKHVSLLDAMTKVSDPKPADNGIDLGEPTLKLIRDLIIHLHKKESDLGKNVLVFLPTYRALEQQYLLLKRSRAQLQVFVLHSSVDIEYSIRAMEVCPLEKRKIILATNVAESSVTIPGVSFVIDSCRSLEVSWDCSSQKDQLSLKWISESQANQRKGRTGRTCEGVVYRMVPRNLFLQFDKFETPAMQLISLKKQVLMIITSVAKGLNDPSSFLKKCMNPPSTKTVEDALLALEDMEAVEIDEKGKHQASLYGRLLISLPLSLESSMMVIRGGQLGYTRESAILASIRDGTPNPISKPFLNPSKYQIYLDDFFTPLDGEVHSHPTIMLANMYAYEFWQRTFQDKKRLEKLLQLDGNSFVSNRSQNILGADSESEWCTEHHLNLTSLRAVAENVDAIMEALHRFRPEFLNNASGPPTYMKLNDDYHTCSIHVPNYGNDSISDASSNFQESYDKSSEEDVDLVLDCEDEGSESHDEKTCLHVPFTSRGDFHSLQVERILTALIVEVQKGYKQPFTKPLEDHSLANNHSDDVPLCTFFLRGVCLKGDDCNFSHSISARPTPCIYFRTRSGCRYGDSCIYYHDDPNREEFLPDIETVGFDEWHPTPSSMLDLVPPLQDGQYVLLFGEGDFSFAESLCSWIQPQRIIATSLDNKEIISAVPSLKERIHTLLNINVQIHWNVDVKSLLKCSTGESAYLTKVIPWWDVRCIIWNFPFADVVDNIGVHQELIVKFFASLNMMMNYSLVHIDSSVPIIITLCNDQFCRWRVERAARDSFFFLTKSSPFDAKTFGGYCPVRNNLRSTFPVEKPINYLFHYHGHLRQGTSDFFHG